MDNLDFRILWELDQNARLSMAELSRRVGASKQMLNYRISRLRDEQVILGFIAGVDIHRLGFFTHRVYFRFRHVDREAEAEIFNYFISHSHTLWVVSITGGWDAEVVFTARNFVHFNNILKKVKLDLGRYFSRYNISMSPVSYAFKRDYLIDARREGFSSSFYGFEPEAGRWDEIDYALLGEISRNCRQSYQDLATTLGVTAQTVKHHAKKLEQDGIIRSYRLRLDLAKLERRYLKVLLYLHNIDEAEEQKLYRFCAARNFVIYLTEVLGEWQLEIETEVRNQEELNPFIRDLRENFSRQLADYEILQVMREYKMNYFPMGNL